MFGTVNEKCHRHLLLDSIIGLMKSNNTLGKEDAFIKLSNSANRHTETTKDWEVLCQWRDSSTTWKNSRMLNTCIP